MLWLLSNVSFPHIHESCALAHVFYLGVRSAAVFLQFDGCLGAGDAGKTDVVFQSHYGMRRVGEIVYCHLQALLLGVGRPVKAVYRAFRKVTQSVGIHYEHLVGTVVHAIHLKRCGVALRFAAVDVVLLVSLPYAHCGIERSDAVERYRISAGHQLGERLAQSSYYLHGARPVNARARVRHAVDEFLCTDVAFYFHAVVALLLAGVVEVCHLLFDVFCHILNKYCLCFSQHYSCSFQKGIAKSCRIICSPLMNICLSLMDICSALMNICSPLINKFFRLQIYIFLLSEEIKIETK